ncbi:hypothetical protein EK904_004279 [Melospiza melodia maxima]|nr:hypothetical protein EK904_004279 [Melospiza melodia maxima]
MELRLIQSLAVPGLYIHHACQNWDCAILFGSRHVYAPYVQQYAPNEWNPPQEYYCKHWLLDSPLAAVPGWTVTLVEHSFAVGLPGILRGAEARFRSLSD